MKLFPMFKNITEMQLLLYIFFFQIKSIPIFKFLNFILIFILNSIKLK